MYIYKVYIKDVIYFCVYHQQKFYKSFLCDINHINISRNIELAISPYKYFYNILYKVSPIKCYSLISLKRLDGFCFWIRFSGSFHFLSAFAIGPSWEHQTSFFLNGTLKKINGFYVVKGVSFIRKIFFLQKFSINFFS